MGLILSDSLSASVWLLAQRTPRLITLKGPPAVTEKDNKLATCKGT